MSMTLYEIEDAILECVDTETGDIIDLERLEQLEIDRATKISNIACWIKDLSAEVEAIKAEKKNLDKRQKAAENKAASLKEFLENFMNGAKYKDGRCAISYRATTKTEVAEGALDGLADEYKTIKTTVTPNLAAIKEALENGVELEGCQLIHKNNIQIK